MANENESRTSENDAPSPAPIVPFERTQEQKDSKYKQLAAEWAVREETRPKTGNRIVLDAGSSCLAVWERLLRDIKGNRLPFMSVCTNNFRVLEKWGEHAGAGCVPVRDTRVELFASQLNPEHLAFYDTAAPTKLLDPNFRPYVVYIGTSAIEFDGSSIFFGYHGPEEQRQIKELLFKCYAKFRVILATPAKIGCAGCHVFDILSVEDLNTEAPIYLVTAAPDPQTGAETRQYFDRAKDIFRSEPIQTAVSKRNLQFKWVILDPCNDGVPRVIEILSAPEEGVEKQG